MQWLLLQVISTTYCISPNFCKLCVASLCHCVQKAAAASPQSLATNVYSALALCQSVALPVDCWSLGPLTAQARLHLLPVVEVLAAAEGDSGATALQVRTYVGVCIDSTACANA